MMTTLEETTGRPRVRIALVLWSSSFGGAEIATVALARALRARGHACCILFVCKGNGLEDRLRQEGIESQQLGFSRGKELLWKPGPLLMAIAAFSPNAVIVAQGEFIPALLRRGRYAGRIVFVDHNGTLPRTPLNRALAWAGRASRTWAADVDVAVSDFVLARMETGRHAKRLVRIYNGLDLDRFHPAPERPAAAGEVLRVGVGARLVPGKGVDDLIRAMERLGRSTPFRLRVAGDGPERPRLTALAAKIGVADFVEFCGYQPDMAEFWRGTDLAVVPTSTLVESFGVSAVEAMACGIPVIGAGRGGLLEVVVDGLTGRLFPAGDVDRLAQALNDYALDLDAIRRHGIAARSRCEAEFDIRKTAADYEALCLGAAPSDAAATELAPGAAPER